MADQGRPQRAEIDASHWRELNEAWGRLVDDEGVVELTDIVPTRFSDVGFGRPPSELRK